MKQVQYEARLAMKYFNEKDDHFESLFLRKVDDKKLRYDNVAKISMIPSKYSLYDQTAKLDFPHQFSHFSRMMPVLLKQSLTDRVKLITTEHEPLPFWSISEDPPNYSSIALFLGIILNQEQCSRLVDYGPTPEDEIAAGKFRRLWGNKAEVRRFQDGSILESVVWESAQGFESRNLIVSHIIIHILNHHFGIKEDHGLLYWAGQLNVFLRANPNIPRSLSKPEIEVQGFQPVMMAYQRLVKELKTVENIPLRISSIKAASSMLRYSSVVLPQPRTIECLTPGNGKVPPFIEPIEIIIQFESSGKWPDNLVAIQKMKIAFYLRLREQLKQQNHGTFAQVVTDNKNSILSNTYLDIFASTGYAFRCRIHHDREKFLLERGIKDKKSTPIQIDAYNGALCLYKRLFEELPMHTSNIHALCSKFPSLSATIRLVKRFMSSHLLLPHIDEETIELLCAGIYLETSPWDVPSSGFAGFFRVLSLISRWDFLNEPLIIDFNGSMSSETKNVIEQQFKFFRQQERDNLNDSVMFIVTSDNPLLNWAKNKPTRLVTFRIKELANLALHYMDQVIENSEDKKFEIFFATDMSVYDVIIHLDPSCCSRYYQNRLANPQYIPEQDKDKKMASYQGEIFFIGYDPVDCYLNELKRLYSDIALFFHDRYGGDFIGVLWVPMELSARSWKVNLGFSSALKELVENEGEDAKNPKAGNNATSPLKSLSSKIVVPNHPSIIANIERLGVGLVTKIEVLQG
ncbi:hypothetical protein G9A89_019272 [Geosiphon pyriformis]|nr:hypothetical protein G9A89_019272 [Geosiphon pyriformis]